jgi:uncharacterized protein YndB with AHSA1/START domain
MIPGRIERDILIEAPVEVVWRAVTEPDQISSWFTDTAVIDVREGGEGTLTWNEGAATKPTTARISVVTVAPPQTFSFRWAHPEGVEARQDNSVLVEFTLLPEGDHTRLRVVETGLLELAWPDADKATYADEHNKGWARHLESLREYMVRPPGESPQR